MFVSFLMPHEIRGRKAHHLMMFYKQVQAFGPDRIAFIGPAEYFRDPAELTAEGRGELAPYWRGFYEYEPPASLEGVRRYVLPDDLFARRLRRRSQLHLYRDLLTERLPELEAAFAAALDELSAQGPIEAVLLFANVRSIEHVAQLRGIPVVHNELAPLRKPVYQFTAYWDLQGVNGHTDALRRYRAFRHEAPCDKVSLLSREELLCAMRRSPAPVAPAAADARYKIGVALQVEDDSNIQAFARGYTGLDLIMMAHDLVGREQTLIRSHPLALARDTGLLGVPDQSPDATSFVQACETILTVNSGTALEALLLGRRCVAMGDTPFGFATDRVLGRPRERNEYNQLLALNFLIFGYLVPYGLMFDPDYTRWRLAQPSEIDIYRLHQRWYREHHACSGHGTAVTLGASTKLLRAALEGPQAMPVIVFGAGGTGKLVVNQLQAFGVDLRGVFDNDVQKWGTHIGGLAVSPPTFETGTTVVIASLSYADEMTACLQALGYPPERMLRLV